MKEKTKGGVMAQSNNLPTNRRNQDSRFLTDFFDLYAREFFSPMLDEKQESFLPKVEVRETEKGYQVRAELPGISEEDIDLSLDDNCLILKGERRSEEKDEQEGNYRSEFSYGSFYRTIPFRADVDDDAIEATYRNGILNVSLVKKRDGTERSKKIEINKSKKVSH